MEGAGIYGRHVWLLETRGDFCVHRNIMNEYIGGADVYPTKIRGSLRRNKNMCHAKVSCTTVGKIL
jgi:hypothetical protein